jgi:hypothetical protein
MTDISKQIRFLKIYTIILTIVVVPLTVMLFFSINNNHFKDLTTERINIVEPNGQLRMVISNQKYQSSGMTNGNAIARRDRPAGMIFFNNDGDEDGGLVYESNKKGAGMVYSFDQYKNDQIMQLQYLQNNNNNGKMTFRTYGLKLWDRDDDFTLSRAVEYIDSLKKLKDTNAYESGIRKLKAAGKLGVQRFFAGKNENGEVGLFINDSKGNTRLKIYIDKNDHPSIQILNQKGEIVSAK